jgi:HSP20 family protein
MVNDLTRLQQQMRRLMDDMLHQLSPKFLLDQRIWSPQIDILETPDSFIIQAEVSGLKREEIQVSVKKDRVYLSGKRERPAMTNAVRYLQMEIEYGAFERVFQLPVQVQAGDIKAVYRDGLLSITLPKRLPSQKVIPIQAE